MFEHDPIDAGLEFTFDLWLEPTVTRESIVGPASDEEWTREEWLAWYEGEFAGYAPDDDPASFVEDDAGEDREAGEEPVRVSQWQLAQDRSTLAHLRRGWLNTYRYSPDGSRSVKGEHPFSTDEGAAEWLARVRIELRDAYRRAGSDRERAAIQSREAALRARHNARCYVRAIVRYRGLDEKLALALVDGWQRDFPIGWLGIEADLRQLFFECQRHFEEARTAWDRAFDGKWTQAQKDEWLDRMPVAPEHPTQLVTSAKKLRQYREVQREQAPEVIDGPVLSKAERERLQRERLLNHRAALLAKLDALRHAPRISRGNIRRWTREQNAEWFDVRKEWERAEMIEAERLDVPESLPLAILPEGNGDLDRAFAELARRREQYVIEREEREKNATRYLGTAA